MTNVSKYLTGKSGVPPETLEDFSNWWNEKITTELSHCLKHVNTELPG